MLSCSRSFYLDGHDTSVASRAVLSILKRNGFAVEAVCGTVVYDGLGGTDVAEVLATHGVVAEIAGENSWSNGPGGIRTPDTMSLRASIEGIPVTVAHGQLRPLAEPTAVEIAEYTNLVESTCRRFRPDVLLVWDTDPLARGVLTLARARSISTVLAVYDLRRRDSATVGEADAVLVPWRFLADYYREVFSVEAAVLSPPVETNQKRTERRGSQFVTFVASAKEAEVLTVSQIAEELACRRPDIPLLVVADQRDKSIGAGGGLHSRSRSNTQVVSPTTDPQSFWAESRVCVVPSVDGMGCAARMAVEAQVNGIPIVGSDRGALPEIVGPAGLLLPLPDRLTPATCIVPTVEEVSPWVEAIVRLWDDADQRTELSRRAVDESGRWAPEAVVPQYVQFFSELCSSPRPALSTPVNRSKSVVLVPHLNGIDPECEQGLDRLERTGVRVVRRVGSSQIDLARSEMASDALHDGFESILFIDADVGFDPCDALHLLARPEPVVAGIYPKKGRRELASTFAPGITEVLFGPEAPGLYPLSYAATGFLRIRTEILRRMITALDLPCCNTKWGRGVWPFFLSLIVPHSEGGYHYLGEDWSFSHQLHQIGVTAMADTSFRLWHWGRYGYTWEDAGTSHLWYRSYNYRIT